MTIVVLIPLMHDFSLKYLNLVRNRIRIHRICIFYIHEINKWYSTHIKWELNIENDFFNLRSNRTACYATLRRWWVDSYQRWTLLYKRSSMWRRKCQTRSGKRNGPPSYNDEIRYWNICRLNFLRIFSHSRVGRGNLVLTHSIPHFSPSFRYIVYSVAELNATLCLPGREN